MEYKWQWQEAKIPSLETMCEYSDIYQIYRYSWEKPLGFIGRNPIDGACIWTQYTSSLAISL